jgi:hypothetical protein
VFLKMRQFSLVHNHSEVVAFKIVVINVGHVGQNRSLMSLL